MSHTPPRVGSTDRSISASVVDLSLNKLDVKSSPGPRGQPSPSPSRMPTTPQHGKKAMSRHGSGASLLAASKGTPWSPPNSVDRKNGRQVANNLSNLRDQGSPSVRMTAGSEAGDDVPSFGSVWDGDDMTLEMVTDINESQVDEDVIFLFLVYFLFLIFFR